MTIGYYHGTKRSGNGNLLLDTDKGFWKDNGNIISCHTILINN
jgi:hypothetical protein